MQNRYEVREEKVGGKERFYVFDTKELGAVHFDTGNNSETIFFYDKVIAEIRCCKINIRNEAQIEAKITPQEKVLKLSAELWNEAFKIEASEYVNPDDQEDILRHVHAIQNIMYTQLYIKKHGKI